MHIVWSVSNVRFVCISAYALISILDFGFVGRSVRPDTQSFSHTIIHGIPGCMLRANTHTHTLTDTVRSRCDLGAHGRDSSGSGRHVHANMYIHLCYECVCVCIQSYRRNAAAAAFADTCLHKHTHLKRAKNPQNDSIVCVDRCCLCCLCC